MRSLVNSGNDLGDPSVIQPVGFGHLGKGGIALVCRQGSRTDGLVVYVTAEMTRHSALVRTSAK
jgi:hypothetical protein